MVPAGHHEELRTYRVLDRAGNLLTLVLQVKGEDHEQTAKILSLRYGSGPLLGVDKNSLKFEWDLNRDGSLKKLNQEAKLGEDGERAWASSPRTISALPGSGL